MGLSQPHTSSSIPMQLPVIQWTFFWPRAAVIYNFELSGFSHSLVKNNCGGSILFNLKSLYSAYKKTWVY
jgi:hypothetical protein